MISLHIVKYVNNSSCSMDANQTGITTLGLSGPGKNGNEGEIRNPQISRTETSASYCLV